MRKLGTSPGKRFIKGFEFVCKCREQSPEGYVSKLPQRTGTRRACTERF